MHFIGSAVHTRKRKHSSHGMSGTFTVRYIRGCEPVERFLKFIANFSHGAKNLADTVVDFLNENNIPLSNCRGQCYDNSSNMSGHYTGLQARIRQLNEFAIFVPCAGHSLNLVRVKAAECCLQIVKFFDFVQRLYSIFLGFYTSMECSGIIFRKRSCCGEASV